MHLVIFFSLKLSSKYSIQTLQEPLRRNLDWKEITKRIIIADWLRRFSMKNLQIERSYVAICLKMFLKNYEEGEIRLMYRSLFENMKIFITTIAKTMILIEEAKIFSINIPTCWNNSLIYIFRRSAKLMETANTDVYSFETEKEAISIEYVSAIKGRKKFQFFLFI